MRRRAFGNIRKLPSGRFQARYKGPDGQERTGERTFEFKGDAQLYLSQVETEMHAGTWGDPRSANETLEHYAETCLANRPRRLKPRTLERYHDLLRLHINPQLGRMPVRRITAAEVNRWHAGRMANTGEATARQAYALLRMILAQAVRDQYLMANPCQIPGAGVARSLERPYMDRTQARALINAMPADMRTLTIITLLAHLRRGEVLALRRGDVDLDKGTLTICRAITLTKAGPVESTTKTGHARVIHLPAEALTAVAEHLAASGPGLPSARLFVHASGRPLEAHHIRTAWSSARAKTGLTQFHFHDLRHAGLTFVTEEGGSLKEVMHRGGHRTVRAAMGYQHTTAQRDADLAARVTIGLDQPASRSTTHSGT